MDTNKQQLEEVRSLLIGEYKAELREHIKAEAEGNHDRKMYCSGKRTEIKEAIEIIGYLLGEPSKYRPRKK